MNIVVVAVAVVWQVMVDGGESERGMMGAVGGCHLPSRSGRLLRMGVAITPSPPPRPLSRPPLRLPAASAVQSVLHAPSTPFPHLCLPPPPIPSTLPPLASACPALYSFHLSPVDVENPVKPYTVFTPTMAAPTRLCGQFHVRVQCCDAVW